MSFVKVRAQLPLSWAVNITPLTITPIMGQSFYVTSELRAMVFAMTSTITRVVILMAETVAG